MANFLAASRPIATKASKRTFPAPRRQLAKLKPARPKKAPIDPLAYHNDDRELGGVYRLPGMIPDARSYVRDGYRIPSTGRSSSDWAAGTVMAEMILRAIASAPQDARDTHAERILEHLMESAARPVHARGGRGFSSQNRVLTSCLRELAKGIALFASLRFPLGVSPEIEQRLERQMRELVAQVGSQPHGHSLNIGDRIQHAETATILRCTGSDYVDSGRVYLFEVEGGKSRKKRPQRMVLTARDFRDYRCMGGA